MQRLNQELRNAEEVGTAAEQAERDATRRDRERVSSEVSVRDRLAGLDVTSDELGALLEILESRLDTWSAETAEMQELEERGSSMSLELARLAEQSRRSELEENARAARAEYESLAADFGLRRSTSELASNVSSALRDLGTIFVELQLAGMSDILDVIYAAADPHPSFSAARFLSGLARGRGFVRIPIEDRERDLLIEEPQEVLSSSQENVLAMAVFLALNLGVSRLPLDAAILDDPLQSLDDVNLLGLVDLLRRSRRRRQLLVSTHDRRFGHLLERKFRPVAGDGRTIVIELDGWDREGPSVSVRDVQAETAPLRLVG